MDQLRQLMNDLQIPDAEEEIIYGPHKAKINCCPQHKGKKNAAAVLCVVEQTE